jgi:hypothetical protein
MRTIAAMILATGFLAFAGCGSSSAPLYEVTGDVTVGGQPLDFGVIALDPADGRGDACGGEITRGAFNLRAPEGPKRVTIRAYRPSNARGPDGRPIQQQYLPEQYNLHTRLTAVVTPQGKNHFAFDLQMK